MEFEQDGAGADWAQPAKPGNVLMLPSEAEVKQHRADALCHSEAGPYVLRAKEGPHPE